MNKDKSEPINDVHRGMELKVIEFGSLLKQMDSIISKETTEGKAKIANSFRPLIGELHHLAERLTDRVVDCSGA